ncbi:MAG TPA: amino acid adenylation domain-containing protein [Pyrinomonadaceae bacterium]
MQDQENGFRLSPRQRELWAFRDEHAADRAQLAILIEGPLRKAELKQALQQVVKRHEILRTNFRQVASLKAPVQVITENWNISAQHVELGQMSRAEQTAASEELFAREGDRMFNHEQEPPLRASLLSLSTDKHLLYLSLLSLCADTRTLRNIADELSRAYTLGRNGLELSDEPLQYVSFAEWHNELLESEEAQAGQQYWRRQNYGDALALKLPFERERQVQSRFKPASYQLRLDGETLAGIGKAAKAQQTTTSVFLLACWQILIWRLTCRSEVVVGVTCDGRKYEELENAMGAFARAIPVGCRLDRDMSFKSLLALTSEALSEAADWHEYFKPERNPSDDASEPGESDFPFVFELVEWPAQFSAADLSFSLYRQFVCLEQFKVKLSALLQGDDLLFDFQYDASLFDEEEISLLAGQFSTLLRSALDDGEAIIGSLEIVCAAERRRMLVEWNDTRVEYAAESCAHQLFEAQAELTPYSLAIEFADERLSYTELNARANQLAHYLRELNVGPDVLVGLMMPRTPGLVIALMAVLKAGGAYVPLDPSYPQERLAFVLEDAGVAVVLTEESLRGRLPEEMATVICPDSQRARLEAESTANLRCIADSENLAYVIYTSGSTGWPKGVMISHRGLVNYLSWATKAYAVQQGDGSPVHSPLGFDLTVTSLLAPLMAGQSVLLLDEEQGLDGLVSALRRRGEFSLVKLTPSHLEVLSQMAAPAEIADWTRAFVIGGEALFEQNLTFWQCHAPATRLINEYGPTETVVGCCIYEVTDELHGQGIVPIGRPIANTQIYLLDERMNPVPVGVAGELYIGGDGLARGYLNRPELTAERFIPHPFSPAPGARLYRSGDLARYRGDGLIEYLGRVDQQVKVRGYRIELGEIEAVLCGVAGVREAIAVVLEDAAGDRRLAAYVTGEPEMVELERQLRQRLPEYMIPTAFVCLPELPLTPNGKVDRAALPAPDEAQQKSKKAFVAPRDVLELELARTWREVLNNHSVGMRDNFFELGGHSMLAARLMARIHQQFGHRLPLTALFQDATIEHLARILRQQTKPASRLSSLVMIQPGSSSRPPFFSVHPSGGNVLCYAELARHLGPDQPVYGLQAQGLDHAVDFRLGIEEMASQYLAELRTVQTVGPYFLGGWSFGGLVAFEMARQLQAQAQEVALLALIDTKIPTPQDSMKRIDEVVLMSNFAADLGLTLEHLEVSLDELLRREPDQQLAYVLEIAREANILPPDLDLSDVRRLYQVFKANVRAMQSYRPTPAECRVTLFQAVESPASNRQETARGWDELALAGVEIHTVPGNHFDMVREPHVQTLAESLRSCMDAAPVFV